MIFPPAVGATLVFIFGAVIGSFLNVCILRIPRGDKISHPASHCPDCKNRIRFYDNVPMISYIILRGRCRSCGNRISPRYFVVELLTAALFVALYYQFGITLAFFTGVVFICALIVISFIDLDEGIVPDVISIPGIVLGLAISIIGRYFITDPFELVPSPLSAFLGVLIGGGFLWAVAWAYYACTGVEGMGGGDIKLLAMIGAFLGWPSILLTLIVSSFAGSIIGLGLMLVKKVGRRYAIPYGPFLCMGALVYVFFGRELIDFYLYPP